jgi:hypothetical protein
MATGAEKRIYGLAALCVALSVLAGIAPRFVPPSSGLESMATAVLLFVGLLFLATLVSLYLFILTVRAYRDISILPRLAGLGPGLVLVTALTALLVLLRY